MEETKSRYKITIVVEDSFEHFELSKERLLELLTKDLSKENLKVIDSSVIEMRDYFWGT